MQHGSPVWYELSTRDAAASKAFYGAVLGWSFMDAGVEGFTYELASAPGGGMVAGLMAAADAHPAWLIYFQCDDTDAFVARATAAGATVLQPAMDVPGTGRFAVLADPLGAAFGVLQPEEMDASTTPATPAFSMGSLGHGGWNELMTPDQDAALAFYCDLFGWGTGETMPMGETGTYQVLQCGGVDFGAMNPLADAPVSNWTPYFIVDDIDDAVARIGAAGGSLHHGPAEVPGGQWIAVAQDSQQTWFCLLGPRRG